MKINNKVQQFLNDNHLTEEKFDKILKEVISHNDHLKLMFLNYPMGWGYCNVKVLERILDIYDNSQVDLTTGKIIKVNFD